MVPVLFLPFRFTGRWLSEPIGYISITYFCFHFNYFPPIPILILVKDILSFRYQTSPVQDRSLAWDHRHSTSQEERAPDPETPALALPLTTYHKDTASGR